MTRAARTLGALVLVVVGFTACRDPEPAADAGRPSHDPPAAGGTERGGVKVPLPPGWTARPTSDDALTAGPPGRTVLRIELLPGSAANLPTPQNLARSFVRSAGAVVVDPVDSQSDQDKSLVVLSVRPARDGGQAARPWLALLGAKRSGGSLFLCSTSPGASEEEVKAAATACAELTRTAPAVTR